LKRCLQASAKALPLPTQVAIGLSKFVKGYILFAIPVVIALIFGFRRYYKRPKTAVGRFDRLTMKIPVIGVLLQKAAVARVTRTLATLLVSGVSILESLSIVAKDCG
jgi:type IV pilus assembly protein PilC